MTARRFQFSVDGGPVQDAEVEIELIADIASRARHAQEAINALGAGPPGTAPMIENDTYGQITRQELADLRANARPCSICGMLATVDPVFHANRYGHQPKLRARHRTSAATSFDWSAARGEWVRVP